MDTPISNLKNELKKLYNQIIEKIEDTTIIHNLIDNLNLETSNINPNLIKSFNKIINTFNYKKEKKQLIALDLCSDLIYNKAELLEHIEFDEIYQLFNIELNTFNFTIEQFKNNELSNLIHFLEKNYNNQIDNFFKKIILAIYLFSICTFEDSIYNFNNLINIKYYKSNDYYINKYGNELINSKLPPRFIDNVKINLFELSQLINNYSESNPVK